MAEVSFEGDYQSEFHQDEEWGLDAWTTLDKFAIVISTEFGGGKAELDPDQCSMLMAALAEHLKEVKDAKQENPSKD